MTRIDKLKNFWYNIVKSRKYLYQLGEGEQSMNTLCGFPVEESLDETLEELSEDQELQQSIAEEEDKDSYIKMDYS